MANNTRLTFSKTGRAKYISHLDIMHTFQRAFYRADLPLRYTQGYNPHAYLSIALALPVGVESLCEMLDFGMVAEVENLPAKLNPVLPEGIFVSRAQASARPFTEIAFVSYEIVIKTGLGTEKLSELFLSPMVIEKKSKKGISMVDIVPMVRQIEFSALESGIILANAVTSAQNPTLSPLSIMSALQKYGDADIKCGFTRKELLDSELTEFE